MNANYKKIKTFSAACKAVGQDAKALAAKWAANGDTEDEIAYKMLKIWYQAVNGNWVADFDNSDQRKYYPYFWNKPKVGFVLVNVYYFYDDTGVSARLCAETRPQAEHVAKYALDTYRKFLSNK